MAEQQTQNTAIVEEKKVSPTDEVEEGPGSKVESPVPPVAKASTLELTESPEVVAAMTVELTTAKTETDALLGAIKEIFRLFGRCRWPRGNIQVDQSDVVGPEDTKVHFTKWLN